MSEDRPTGMAGHDSVYSMQAATSFRRREANLRQQKDSKNRAAKSLSRGEKQALFSRECLAMRKLRSDTDARPEHVADDQEDLGLPCLPEVFAQLIPQVCWTLERWALLQMLAVFSCRSLLTPVRTRSTEPLALGATFIFLTRAG